MNSVDKIKKVLEAYYRVTGRLFVPCPDCKGEGGFYSVPDMDYPNHYEGCVCDTCNGKGVVERISGTPAKVVAIE